MSGDDYTLKHHEDGAAGEMNGQKQRGVEIFTLSLLSNEEQDIETIE